MDEARAPTMLPTAFHETFSDVHKKSDVPILKAKAFNALLVADWIAGVSQQVAEQSPDEYSRMRALCMYGLHAFYDVMRKAGPTLTDEEARRLQTTHNALVYGFAYMHDCACEGGLRLWPAKPKMHMIAHILSRALATRRNPASSWIFQEEDNVGTMIKIATACHGATYQSRSIERWLAQWCT